MDNLSGWSKLTTSLGSSRAGIPRCSCAMVNASSQFLQENVQNGFWIIQLVVNEILTELITPLTPLTVSTARCPPPCWRRPCPAGPAWTCAPAHRTPRPSSSPRTCWWWRGRGSPSAPACTRAPGQRTPTPGETPALTWWWGRLYRQSPDWRLLRCCQRVAGRPTEQWALSTQSGLQYQHRIPAERFVKTMRDNYFSKQQTSRYYTLYVIPYKLCNILHTILHTCSYFANGDIMLAPKKYLYPLQKYKNHLLWSSEQKLYELNYIFCFDCDGYCIVSECPQHNPPRDRYLHRGDGTKLNRLFHQFQINTGTKSSVKNYKMFQTGTVRTILGIRKKRWVEYWSYVG